ncbi:hypothetical protein FPOAC1_007264 [Fusarium poae]|uniref:hypothetical protein n=1 Tax=Fusarium poae TaxID=36050 RepID=UPI001CE9F7AD|nr:hypothetical protein FPOAC1_007264 [Fusarium poae]KAG8673945.1 hypothetical protein FPOAC1_007264 [Fusarium poae]GKU06612.1 unnamed protein product [Fusarium langsethiae]
MSSPSIDFEQRKPLQGFTPSVSQLSTTSSYSKEALLASGRSRETAIYIPSDDESGDDAENDASQLDSAQTCATRASTPSYLDLTTTEHDTTDLDDAVISADTTLELSSTQAEVALAWPNEPRVSHLVNPEPTQQSSVQMDHSWRGNTSACYNGNFIPPPISRKSQPYSVAADGKQLQPKSVIQQSDMMVDAPSSHVVCHNSQGHWDSLLTGAHSPQAVSPVKVVQVSLKENEIAAGNSYNNTIRAALTLSPAGSSDKPCQGRALQMHKVGQCKDSDAGNEGPGSKDSLDRPESLHHIESSSSLLHIEDPELEYYGLDDFRRGRKRRKVLNSPLCALPSEFRTSKHDSSILEAAELLVSFSAHR